MDSSLSKILKIFLGVLLLISVAFILMFYIGGKEEFTETPNNTNLILIWSYILLGITAAAAILFPIYALIKNPKNVFFALIGIIGLVVLFGIGYLLADDVLVKLPKTYSGGDNNPATLKFVGTAIYAMYFLLLLAILGIFVSEIRKVFKK